MSGELDGRRLRRIPRDDGDGGGVALPPMASGGYPPLIDSQFVSRMVESDLPRKVQERWFNIFTSKEFRLSKFNPRDEEQIKANDLIAEIYDIMRRPPPGSYYNQSSEGLGKYSFSDALVAKHMASYRIAELARSRDGFEREMLTQSTQVLAHEGGDMRRPGFFKRVFGGFFGGGDR